MTDPQDSSGNFSGNIASQGCVTLREISTPFPNPGGALGSICVGTDRQLYFVDSGGAVTRLTPLPRQLWVCPRDGPNFEIGNWNICRMLVNGTCFFNFVVPDDFVSLLDVAIHVIPDATETIQWDLYASVSGEDEAYDNDDRSNLNNTKAVTNKALAYLSITSSLGGLSPGDDVTVKIQSDITAIQAIGLLMKYK